MKKNLFILFVLYLFVVQPIIVWLLRNETRAFWLGFINLILIILIIAFYYVLENKKEWKADTENDKKIYKANKEENYYKHENHHEKPKSHLSGITIFGISLLAIIVIYFFLYWMDFGLKILSISIIWIIIFIILTLIFDIHKFRKFRKLFATKFYMFFIIISIVFSVVQFLQSWFTPLSYLANNWSNLNNPPQKIQESTNFLTWKWAVLDTEINTDANIPTDTQETSSDVIETSDLVLPVENNTAQETPTANVSNNLVTMMDAIIHLIDVNKIPLITKQDILFTYVSTKNPYYNYYRTAYSKKMIGKDTNPSKNVACKTYMVMKGLAEWRNVSYTQSNVMENFWQAAVSKDALNDCIKWQLVRENNL